MKAIMVGVDGSSHSDVAVRYAIEIADLFGAKVIGVAAVAEDFDGERASDEQPRERLEGLEYIANAGMGWFRDALEECGEACQVADVEFIARVLSGKPTEVLAEEAQSADMLVIGAKGRRAKHVELLGSTTRRVLRKCIKPVLVTRDEHKLIQRIMVGYDGSPASGHAVEWAADLAAAGRMELGIVTGAFSGSGLAESLEYVSDLVRTRGIEPDAMRVKGDAPGVIFDRAREWDPDLIAIGGAVKGTLSGFFLGEAWPDIVEQSRRPVLRWR